MLQASQQVIGECEDVYQTSTIYKCPHCRVEVRMAGLREQDQQCHDGKTKFSVYQCVNCDTYFTIKQLVKCEWVELET